MACCLVALALMVPRILLAVFYFFTEYYRVFQTWYWPLLGFFFLPFTTLAYMAAMLNNDGKVDGWWIILMVVAVIMDLSSGGSAKKAKEKSDTEARTGHSRAWNG